jgi:hypothetical protein
MRELEITGQAGFVGKAALGTSLLIAVQRTCEQGKVTWLTENGGRIAAIVPVDMAEYALRHGYTNGGLD